MNNKSCHVPVTPSCPPICPTLIITRTVHAPTQILQFFSIHLRFFSQHTLLRQPIETSCHGQSIEPNNRRHLEKAPLYPYHVCSRSQACCYNPASGLDRSLARVLWYVFLYYMIKIEVVTFCISVHRYPSQSSYPRTKQETHQDIRSIARRRT